MNHPLENRFYESSTVRIDLMNHFTQRIDSRLNHPLENRIPHESST
ncbi:hypothetical protein CEXT_67341, partial [Caerostris extrusa]